MEQLFDPNVKKKFLIEDSELFVLIREGEPAEEKISLSELFRAANLAHLTLLSNEQLENFCNSDPSIKREIESFESILDRSDTDQNETKKNEQVKKNIG
ncbi:MAG: hypothetical protein ABI597_02830 [Gammaproteobacteria bacterium]